MSPFVFLQFRVAVPEIHFCTAQFPFPRHTAVGAAGGCPRSVTNSGNCSPCRPLSSSAAGAETSAGRQGEGASDTVTCGYAICHAAGVLDEVLIAHRGVKQGSSVKQLKNGRGTSGVAPVALLEELWRTCSHILQSEAVPPALRERVKGRF